MEDLAKKLKIEEKHNQTYSINEIIELLKQLEILKEFADKLDNEFGKDAEPTLSERADNIIALYRTNKQYCIYVDTKIKELKQQLAEKDKEIEKLKQQYTILENENGKLTTELIMDKYKKAQKEVSFGKQLAIQELEKVRKEFEIRLIGKKWEDKMLIGKVCNMINDVLDNQIKELKGE